MRIISPFKDFYDSVQGLGQDRSMAYLRQPYVEESERGKLKVTKGDHRPFVASNSVGAGLAAFSFGDQFARNGVSVKLHQGYIGFCGKLYTVMYGWLCPQGEISQRKIAIYSIKRLDELVEKYGTTKDKLRYDDRYKPFVFKGKTYLSQGTRYSYEKFFNNENTEPILKRFTAKAFDKGIPIITECRDRVAYHCCLKEVDFQTVVPPYEAYQELFMWIGNQAEPRKPIPVPSDEDMVEIKGFDKRFSFRKPKREK